MSVEDLIGQVNLIQKVMSAVMKDGEHFGKIPGCGDKPSLLQPGAQKLMVTFRLAPEYNIIERELDKSHREYRVTCTLKTIGSGSFVGQGAGSASTMEGKWRFRVAPKKLTDRPVPKEYWNLRQSDPVGAQQLLGGKGFSTKKDDNGQWMIAEGSSDKVEHDNPADNYNTVLKMACKRALVAAVLTATAASDIFTQDVEELAENMRPAVSEPSEATPSIKTPPAKPQEPKKAAMEPADDPPFDSVEPSAVIRQPEPSDNDGEAETIGTIEAISNKTGTNAKGPWTKTSLKVNGEWYQTFSDTISKGAKSAKDTNRSVRIIYKEETHGNFTNRNITFLTILES